MKEKNVDFKTKTLEELNNLAEGKQADLARLRFRHSMGQLEKTAELRKIKKMIAQLKTFARQKELGEGARQKTRRV